MPKGGAPAEIISIPIIQPAFLLIMKGKEHCRFAWQQSLPQKLEAGTSWKNLLVDDTHYEWIRARNEKGG
jgi:hypothetical protein